MNWTTEFPKEPGTYWVRKFPEVRRGMPGLDLPDKWITTDTGPELVEVGKNGSVIWIMRTEWWGDNTQPDTSSSEWYGPIDPPE